ncbi:MAG TPA: GNAT family N-acetyltransferase [Plantibacter sp.]|uniref:GNAT family N-acetyltransferase n=1 Tax=unclassified Plantibacter TaxID=2624265 RepID=UPI002CE90017|nr:GNAT family N-acetyltransferase [Plantibacter sp.]
MSGSVETAGAWLPRLPVRTERLLLRAHRREDLDDLVVFHSDPAVTRFIPGPVRTREQTAEALELKLTRAVAATEGDWLVLAVEDLATGRVIGEVLLKRTNDAERIGEVGYAFATAAQGRGFASEAVRSILQLGFTTFGLQTIVARVETGNDASSRLLDRLGFELDPKPEVEESGVELLVYRRAR